MDLRGRSLLKEADLSREEFTYLVDLGHRLREEKRLGFQARRLAARLSVTADVAAGVAGADFLHTEVWLSMGESPGEWDQRIKQLLPYQVNAGVMAATGNPAVKFMHCLPALHGTSTETGQQIYGKFGLTALEVTDDVFESRASIVFDQAENRMHTIKATVVATIPPLPS